MDTSPVVGYHRTLNPTTKGAGKVKPCRYCQDTGRVIDYAAGESRFVPCRNCGHREGGGLMGAIVTTVGLAMILAVGALILAAWFGDLSSIPLIGK